MFFPWFATKHREKTEWILSGYCVKKICAYQGDLQLDLARCFVSWDVFPSPTASFSSSSSWWGWYTGAVFLPFVSTKTGGTKSCTEYEPPIYLDFCIGDPDLPIIDHAVIEYTCCSHDAPGPAMTLAMWVGVVLYTKTWFVSKDTQFFAMPILVDATFEMINMKVFAIVLVQKSGRIYVEDPF